NHLIADVVGWFPPTSLDEEPPPTTTSPPQPLTCATFTKTHPALPNQIQAVYAVPTGGTPVAGREAAVASQVASVQAWYDQHACGYHPVFVRNGDALSVVTVQLPQTEAA